MFSGDYFLPGNPCEGWTVADLVGHVVTGNQMAIELLDGLRDCLDDYAKRSAKSD